jgi:hypothetical protein
MIEVGRTYHVNMKGNRMPIYTVFEVEEEVVIRKWRYERIEAEDEDAAIEIAMSRVVEATEHGVVSEPEYVTQGFAARPIEKADEMAWDEALQNLADRRQI